MWYLGKMLFDQQMRFDQHSQNSGDLLAVSTGTSYEWPGQKKLLQPDISPWRISSFAHNGARGVGYLLFIVGSTESNARANNMRCEHERTDARQLKRLQTQPNGYPDMVTMWLSLSSRSLYFQLLPFKFTFYTCRSLWLENIKRAQSWEM